jgi:hypothetical protein
VIAVVWKIIASHPIQQGRASNDNVCTAHQACEHARFSCRP